MTFPHHVIVEARCEKKWRGANFDQANAEANVGAALADLWKISPRSQEGLEALLKKAFVRSYGERRDINPTTTFDPEVGEAFEFHVGLRTPTSEEERARIVEAIVGAVQRSRHFKAGASRWT